MLRAAREKMCLALLDVEASTGLMGGGISHLENGRSIPSLMTALILCNFYGLSLKKLAEAVAEDELEATTRKPKPIKPKPYRRIRTPRRVRLNNLRKHKRQKGEKRRKALDELAAYDQELGI